MATLHVNDNPFPGIRSYEIHEDELFFGREQQVRELTEKLAKTRFLAIVGSSGCGKSSLIKAGLIPALLKNKPGNFAKGWKLSIFRPSDDPIGNLAASLVTGAQNADALAAGLRNGSTSLVGWLKANDKDEASRLIIIDQFEELFRFRNSRTLAGTVTETALFVRMVLDAITDTSIPVYIVLSMRTDFLDECTAFRGLSEEINQGYYLVPRMNNEERRLAITGPVAMKGAQIAEELVGKLLEDVGDDPDQLPIMQHAMMRTWEHWTMNRIGDQPIGLAHYTAIGTMKEALSVHLEEIYADLRDDKSKFIAEKLFKALTDITKESRGTRRPTQLSEIMTLAGAREEELVRVIDSFRKQGCAFLMPSSHISIGPESTIDISHESIMRVWTRLRKWVEEESRSAGLYLRLSKSAELYQEGKTGLWINPELQLALQWKDQAKPNATWAMRYDPAFDRAMTFLLYSKKQHELELVKKEAQQKRNLKRARTSAVVLGIAAIVSILFLLISLNLRFKAEASRKVALEKEKLAVSKSREMDEQRREAILQKKISEQQQQIAEQQKIITEEQRQYAVEQQGIAQEKTQVAIKEQKRAEESRRQALQARDAEETQRKAAVAQKEIADRERVKAESSGKESRRLRLLAISRSMAIQAGLLHNTVKDDLPALLALESFRLNAENGGSSADPAIYAALADISGDQQILRGHEDGVRGEALTTDGKTLFTCGDDNRLLVWKIDEPQSPPATFSIPKQARGTVRCVAVTPDSYWLIAGTTGGDLLLWKRGTVNEPAIVLRAHSGIVNALAMNPAGGTFASAGADGKLLVWNGSKEPFTRSVADSSSIKINCAAFSPDGKTLAWGTASGQVKTLLLTPSLPHSFTSSPPNSLPPSLLPSAMNGIQCLTYSPDGRWLAAGLASGTILAWETASPAARPHEILGRHLSGVNALAFSPDGKMLASASFDRTIKMAGFPDPESNPISIQNHELWVYGTLFTPDGSRLISCSADKTIRIFTTASERIAAALMKKITRNMTPDEWRKMVGSDIPYQKTREDLPVPDNSSNTSN